MTHTPHPEQAPPQGAPGDPAAHPSPAGQEALQAQVTEAQKAAAAPAVDPSRPFGVHVRMSWWKPLVIIPLLIILFLLIQVVTSFAVLMFEALVLGKEFDPSQASLSPLMMLTANLSIAVMGLISVALMRWIGKVPVREQFRIGRRTSWWRLGVYAGIFLVLLLVVNAIYVVVDPSLLPSITLSGGVIALILISLLTTPLQAAAEEVMFRGAIMPSIGAWIRPVKASVVVALIVSSLIFGFMHASLDPWLLSYYILFGVFMALMALISRGLEAPIAFHVVNNVVLMVLAALGTEDGHVVMDRSVGMGGPFMLAFIAMDAVAVLAVWLVERRRRASESDRAAQVTGHGHGGVAQPTP